MDCQTVRAKFELFAGTGKYRKFVLALNEQSAKRLRFWQEQLWEPFRADHNLDARSFDELRALFRYCHIHGNDLDAGVVPVVYGTQRPRSDNEINRELDQYPYARPFVRGPCWIEEATEVSVFYCSQCRTVLAELERAG